MTIDQRGFWSSVVVVLGGAATAQAIPLLGSLVLARLFAPAEYGLFATWLGLVSIGAVAMTGRYEMALAIEADGRPRRVAATATLAIILVVGALLTVVSLLIAWTGAAGRIDTILWCAAGPSAAAIAASQTWQAWAAADGRYHDLATIRIAQAAGITAAQIAAGLMGASAVWLAAGHLAGVLLGTFTAASKLPLALAGLPRREWLREGLDFLSRQRRFPLLALPADSVNTAAAQLPLLILANRFGAEMAGLLALTLRIVGAPIGLLGASVLDVFRRRSAESFSRRGECRAEYVETFKMLSIGAMTVAIALVLVAESAFAVAFGDRWSMSGTMAAWLMPMFALRFVASPLSYMFYVAGKQHLDLVWQIALLAMTMISLWLPMRAETALQAYGAGYAALYGIYLVMAYRLSKGIAR